MPFATGKNSRGRGDWGRDSRSVSGYSWDRVTDEMADCGRSWPTDDIVMPPHAGACCAILFSAVVDAGKVSSLPEPGQHFLQACRDTLGGRSQASQELAKLLNSAAALMIGALGTEDAKKCLQVIGDSVIAQLRSTVDVDAIAAYYQSADAAATARVARATSGSFGQQALRVGAGFAQGFMGYGPIGGVVGALSALGTSDAQQRERSHNPYPPGVEKEMIEAGKK